MAAHQPFHGSNKSEKANQNEGTLGVIDDPFTPTSSSHTSDQRRVSHRYSSFDTQLFAHYQPSTSPSSAKRALEAHLSETDRRLEEAAKLGTALVRQRKDISERLKEVEKQQGNGEIGIDLRRKLVEVEKEYNELGRESARSFLAPKARHGGVEETSNGNITLDSRNPASPTKFSSQAIDSPSMLNTRSRKQRNQISNRVDDIEFVTEISTSLLAQVRQLQAVLAERDETLKILNLEKTRLEIDVQGLSQRIRSLDESEQRYKDENWSLETQTHDLLATAKESASRDQRLQQSLAVANSEKSTAQRDLDDLRQAHGKLVEDHAAFRKAHESELGSLRKGALLAETDRSSLQRKIEELTSQNQELARAVAGAFKHGPDIGPDDLGSEPEDLSLDRSDPEHSPPPSPTKSVVRNSMLESETLKSSLHHAHRMIQNLKSTIHREKTEKQEVKRMLQEARDELELRRNEAATGNNSRRPRLRSQHDQTKKASKIGQLGAGRANRTDIEITDPDWEEQGEVPSRDMKKSAGTGDLDHSANETEDAFETANERETSTETEAFQTGNESLAGDSSDDLTETEGGTARQGTTRASRTSSLPSARRSSYISTASTSDDANDHDMKTPVQQSLKYRLRTSRGSRRSRTDGQLGNTPPSMQDSPASLNSGRATKGQSLFAELGDFGGENSGEDVSGTPLKASTSSTRPTPAKVDNAQQVTPNRPGNLLIDSGTMTEPWGPPMAIPDSQLVGTASLEQQIRQNAVQDEASSQSQKDSILIYTPSNAPRGTITYTDTDTDTSTSSQLQGTSNGSSAQKLFTFSSIRSLETHPSELARPTKEDETERPSIAIQGTTDGLPNQDVDRNPPKTGVVDSVLGWALGKKQPPSTLNDKTSEDGESNNTARETQTPFVDSLSAATSGYASRNDFQRDKPLNMSDQSSQTMLSADEVDNLLSIKAQKLLGHNAPDSFALSNDDSSHPVKNSPQPGSTPSSKSLASREVLLPARSLKRPNSSGSVRTSNTDMPPLPADHRQAIAAAEQGASKEKSDGLMGPPTAPASAYRRMNRRPQTPNDQTMQIPISNTPRARYSTTRSARSRRSSISSFESEIDARFNIRAEGMPLVQGMESNTDPRMIQAITQTMIGEYLWKYTRKAGRGEMSDKRHRRFFWVHPYTRTLYWSNQDPSTAGRAQLKAKSVAIEAVRVVVDDNPMPPGLHRKSLIVITPGRDVKFTATTGQRHETWFNSLSYLLLRSGPEPQYADPAGLTPEDINEFNPGFVRATGSRISLSSYNSRTNTTRQSQASSGTVSPSKGSVRRIPATPHASTVSRYSNAHDSSIASRFGTYWRASRSSPANKRESNGSGTIYSASVVNDSAEDVRQVLKKQEQEADRLENVRACCDGKHDVGSLNRRTATSGRLGTTSHHPH